MAHQRWLAAALALTSALSACRPGAAEATKELERDLAAATAASVDLAPRGAGRIEVVSAEELGGAPALTRAAPAVRPAAARRPVAVAQPRRQPRTAAPVPAPAMAPATVAAAPDPAPEPAPVVEAPAPEPAPAVTGPLSRPPERTPEPPGGYHSVSDVIRNAPFPINP